MELSDNFGGFSEIARNGPLTTDYEAFAETLLNLDLPQTPFGQRRLLETDLRLPAWHHPPPFARSFACNSRIKLAMRWAVVFSGGIGLPALKIQSTSA